MDPVRIGVIGCGEISGAFALCRALLLTQRRVAEHVEGHARKLGEIFARKVASRSTKQFDHGGDSVRENREAAAHRFEYGFVGVDAVGRHYADSPRPHLRAAAEATLATLKKSLWERIASLSQRS